MMGRAEWRTDSGWQRFDRVALIVSLLLLLALLIVWFSGTSMNDDSGEHGPLAAAPALEESASPRSESPATGSEPPDNTASTDTDAGENAAAPGTDVTEQTRPGADDADQEGPGKSLASQDPARQATFERIPKYLDQPIATGADGDDATSARGSGGNQTGATAKDSTTTGSTGQSTAAESTDATEQAGERLPASVMTEAAGPKVTPILELRSADGGLTIDGIVSSESLRADILKAGLTAYGMRNLTNRLAVNAAVAPFDWSGDAADLIVLIGGPESETVLRIDGNTVTLAGEVPAIEDKEARALAAQQFFGTRARVDNRLRVIAPEKPVASAAEPASEPINVAGLGQPADDDNASQSGSGAARAEPLAPVVPATGGDNAADADLAEGGPGQIDSVTLLPTGLPERIARGDCPRVATSVLIPFGSASTDLTEAARAALDKLAPCLSRRNYLVGGHTDNRGSAANNRALSRERAQAVVEYLVDAGVPTRRLTAVGHGESRPIISNRSERGRARNRRVDFRLKR